MGMFDFSDVHVATKSEQIRAYAIEQALELRRNDAHMFDTTLLNTAACIEHYIKTGLLSQPQLDAVYNEGASESRWEVKRAVEAQYDNIDLADLFLNHEWAVK